MTRLPEVTQTRALTTWRRTALLLSSVLLVLPMMAAMARSPLADDGQEAADFVRGFSDQALTMLSDETLDSHFGSSGVCAAAARVGESSTWLSKASACGHPSLRVLLGHS